MSENSSKKHRFKIWLSQSEFDLKAATTSLDNKHYEWVCYQAIQSVEKAFKAVIVQAGFRPPKTHKLGVLVSMSNQANNLFEKVKLEFRKLESYTFISRYPFVIPNLEKTPHELITKQDAETCIKLATDIYNKVSDFVYSQTPKLGKDKDLEMSEYYYTAKEIDERLEQVKKELINSDKQKLNVKKIMLFGSFARDKHRPRSSTMDLLVIADTTLDFIDRIHYVRLLTKGGVPIIEPIVYTEKEFEQMTQDEAEGFLETAIDEGRVIWGESEGK